MEGELLKQGGIVGFLGLFCWLMFKYITVTQEARMVRLETALAAFTTSNQQVLTELHAQTQWIQMLAIRLGVEPPPPPRIHNERIGDNETK